MYICVLICGYCIIKHSSTIATPELPLNHPVEQIKSFARFEQRNAISEKAMLLEITFSS